MQQQMTKVTIRGDPDFSDLRLAGDSTMRWLRPPMRQNYRGCQQWQE